MEKQIEEMAKVMLEASTNANVEPVFEMEGKEVVLGENATKVLNNILEQAFIPFLAEVLYNAGYRKASDVAREIFKDLELKAPFFCENQIAYEHFYEELAELKKKYIGKDTNVTTNTEDGK